MENFVVSARKYRPATFDTVVGQGHITTTLKNAIRNNHLAQAFLFCGPRGVGKTTCARILAKTINCTNLTAETEACGKCESCVAFQQNGSMNVYELDAASNNSVDDIRSLVEQVRFPPQTGTRKVYIIDEVHMLSQSAFNAFLKTLEEPPNYVIFILATTEKHKIIPTILSRTQIFDFKRIEISDISQHLGKIAQNEKINAEKDALDVIAQKADGGLRDALSLFDRITTFSEDNQITYESAISNLHVLDYDYYFKVSDALLAENAGLAMLFLDEILRKGFDGHNFIVGLAEHFRNLMVCKNPQTVKLLEVAERAEQKYLQQSQEASSSFLLSALNLANYADMQYKSSKNPRLLVELTLMKISNLSNIFDTQRLLQNVEAEKKKSHEESVSEKTKNVVQENVGSTYQKIKKTPKLNDLKSLAKQPIAQKKEYLPFTFENVRNCFERQKKVIRDLQAQTLLNNFEVNNKEIIIKLSAAKDEGIFSSIEGQLKKSILNQFGEGIKINLKVIELKQERRPYTNSEKFAYLRKKYPIVEELTKKLSLDVKF